MLLLIFWGNDSFIQLISFILNKRSNKISCLVISSLVGLLIIGHLILYIFSSLCIFVLEESLARLSTS